MSEDVKENLRLSLRMMLKPLVKLMIAQGVTHSDFAEAAKDVFVEMAIRHFEDGDRINQSRIAVLTGLTRKEVKRVIVRAYTSEVHGKGFSRPSRVLLGWHSDPVFVGPYGIPLDLPYDSVDDEPSFKSLVKVYGSDMAPRQMLEVLLASGAIVETDESTFKALRRSFEPKALSPQLLERFGDVAHNFFSTAARNIDKKSSSDALFERVVSATRPLSDKEVLLLSEYIKQHGQAFLEKIDNWIVSLPEAPGVKEKRETGLGMYHYVESTEDKSSLKDLLIERGLEIKDEKPTEA
ncbi:MAG: DUF6502 family protein [Pseudomonadota bacterium]